MEDQDRCVLVVEDNPLNMKLFSAVITAQGYGVLQAKEGQGGLRMARTHRPDLIIMDINLPGMSGLQATRMLKQDHGTRGIPILVTSATSRADDEEIAASGCDGFVAKPISVGAFAEILSWYMEEAPGRPVAAF